MLRFVTAGESHGPALVTVIDGCPAGVPLRPDDIDAQLARRQAGYGRGPRARQTVDRCRLLAGVSGGRTTGAPVAIEIPNPEPPNPPAPAAGESVRQGNRGGDPGWPAVPRPGHADLALAGKYGSADFWPRAERASARETAARVAAAAVARSLIRELGIEVGSHVTAIGGVASPHRDRAARTVLDEDGWRALFAAAETDPVRCADPAVSRRLLAAIDAAAAAGDTLGGTFEVVALGCPAGLGGFGQWDGRLDARLAAAVMSVPGVKGVAFGLGFEAADLPGSLVHDPVVPGGDPTRDPAGGPGGRPGGTVPYGLGRAGNRAGGVEGGLCNGSPLVLVAAMKPIPTLGKPLPSVDLESGEPRPAPRVRGDVCAVPAAAAVAEAMVAWELAVASLERYGGDTLAAVLAAAGRRGGGA